LWLSVADFASHAKCFLWPSWVVYGFAITTKRLKPHDHQSLWHGRVDRWGQKAPSFPKIWTANIEPLSKNCHNRLKPNSHTTNTYITDICKVSALELNSVVCWGVSTHWSSVDDLTTHAISGLCLDDVIVLYLRRYDIFAKASKQLWIKHASFTPEVSALARLLHLLSNSCALCCFPNLLSNRNTCLKQIHSLIVGKKFERWGNMSFGRLHSQRWIFRLLAVGKIPKRGETKKRKDSCTKNPFHRFVLPAKMREGLSLYYCKISGMYLLIILVRTLILFRARTYCFTFYETYERKPYGCCCIWFIIWRLLENCFLISGERVQHLHW